MKFKNISHFLIFYILLLILLTFPQLVKAQGAYFRILPDEGSYRVGEKFAISILLDVEEMAANAGQAGIYFPTERLRVLGISTQNSIFSIWAQEPTFSNSLGTIFFVGGLPNPGFIGGGGEVMTIFFQGKSEGEISISFDNEIVTANAPLGKNIFSSSQGANFLITPGAVYPEATPDSADNEPPHSFQVTVDNGEDPSNPAPLFYFETYDDYSGMSHYEVEVGDNTYKIKVGKTLPWKVPHLDPGDYEISIKAFDNANNYTENRIPVKIESIAAPQITICPKRINLGEEMFYLGGIALPSSKVLIFFEIDKKLVKNWEIESGGDGNWFLTKDFLAKAGIKKVIAKTEDARGAISNSSEPCYVDLLLGAFALGPWVINYRALNILGLVLLLLLLIVIFYFDWRIRKSKKILRRESIDLKNKFYKEYNELKIDIENELKILEKIMGEKGLIEEEKKRKEQLLENLADIEEVFKKELKDIEDIG